MFFCLTGCKDKKKFAENIKSFKSSCIVMVISYFFAIFAPVINRLVNHTYLPYEPKENHLLDYSSAATVCRNSGSKRLTKWKIW